MPMGYMGSRAIRGDAAGSLWRKETGGWKYQGAMEGLQETVSWSDSQDCSFDCVSKRGR